MKITFFEVASKDQGAFKGLFSDYEVKFFEEKLDLNKIEEFKDSEIISIFINSVINKEVIDLLPALKFITTRSTGFDHIDLKYCESKGIKVSNVPAYGSKTVAEFAFALIISLSRKVFPAVGRLKEEGNFSINGLRGFDLAGKNIGVIGTGKIGKNVIKIAKGFGMNVCAYDLYPDNSFAAENGFIYKTLQEVISESDILTLHTPYTKENHHLINREKISSMKKGVYIVNTARGELIDTNALIWGLNEGIIAGAGLDVLEGERELKEEVEILSSIEKSERVKDYKTLLEDKVLIDMPNVIVTPHIAFYSQEAEEEIKHTTLENIKSFLNGAGQNLIK